MKKKKKEPRWTNEPMEVGENDWKIVPISVAIGLVIFIVVELFIL